MSFFCSSTPSKASTVVSKVAPTQLLPFLYPAEFLRSSPPRSRRDIRRQSPLQMVSATTPTLEAWFLKSLASAGHCQKHHAKSLRRTTFFSSQRPDLRLKRKQVHNITFQRQNSTQEPNTGDLQDPNLTKEELLDMVDQYDGQSLTDQLPVMEEPSLYQPSDGPHITVTDKPEDEWPPPQYTWPADTETKAKLSELEAAMEARELFTDPEDLYHMYQALPGPRAPYLPSELRHNFLRHLYSVEHKNETSMLRYLSVVDDVKKAGIPLNSLEWNSAISFVARYAWRSTEVEVEAALHMFREMEQVAGVKANGTTFNVLFDVACKAGKFALAEMVYKEMEARGIEFDRFHHVSLISYHGLRRNGDGVRAAYRSLVESHEMVDTVVLNAMISALIQSYETSAAENIYQRMKNMHIEQPSGSPLPPRDVLSRRKFTRLLKRLAKASKLLGNANRNRFQRQSIVAPDLNTFRILVNHFAIEAGDLAKAATLLEEMKLFEVPVHGALFLALFRGFATHGGVRSTEWTEKRLESVWKSYMYAIEKETEDLYTSQWMAIWVLRAFAKCSGKARTAAVWTEIKTAWEPNERDLDWVLTKLRPLMEGPDAAITKKDWLLGSM